MYAIEQTTPKSLTEVFLILIKRMKMVGMIGFMLIILGATGFASVYGWGGLLTFLLLATIAALLTRARQLRRI
jgi:hypothetical protein